VNDFNVVVAFVFFISMWGTGYCIVREHLLSGFARSSQKRRVNNGGTKITMSTIASGVSASLAGDIDDDNDDDDDGDVLNDARAGDGRVWGAKRSPGRPPGDDDDDAREVEKIILHSIFTGFPKSRVSLLK